MSSSTTKNPQRPPSVFERGSSYCTVVPAFFVSLLCYECFLLEMDGIRLGNACQLEGLTLPFRANAFILCLCGFDLDATTTRASKGWGRLYQSLVPPPRRWFLCCPVRSSARCVTRWGGAAVCRSYREAAGRGGAGGTAAGLLLSELQEAQRGGRGAGS